MRTALGAARLRRFDSDREPSHRHLGGLIAVLVAGGPSMCRYASAEDLLAGSPNRRMELLAFMALLMTLRPRSSSVSCPPGQSSRIDAAALKDEVASRPRPDGGTGAGRRSGGRVGCPRGVRRASSCSFDGYGVPPESIPSTSSRSASTCLP